MKKTTIILLVLFCFSVALNIYYFTFCYKCPKLSTEDEVKFLGSDKCFGGEEIAEDLARDLVIEYKKAHAGSPCGFVLSKDVVKLMLEKAENNNCFTFDLATNVDTRMKIYETSLIIRSCKLEIPGAQNDPTKPDYIFKYCPDNTVNSNIYIAYTLCPKICNNW